MVLSPNRELRARSYYIPPVCEAFNLAQAVFIGRVVNASQKREYVYDDDTDEPSVACSLEVVFEVAEVITIEPGKTNGPFDLRLAHTLEKHTIQGIVVWPDDTKDYEYEIQVYWRNHDEKASDEINKSPVGRTSATSEVEKLKITDNVKDLKIVLSKQG